MDYLGQLAPNVLANAAPCAALKAFAEATLLEAAGDKLSKLLTNVGLCVPRPCRQAGDLRRRSLAMHNGAPGGAALATMWYEPRHCSGGAMLLFDRYQDTSALAFR